MFYNKELLDNFCKENDITLIDCPDHINSTAVLKGKCVTCSNTFEKSMFALITRGAGCSTCMTKRSVTKRLETLSKTIPDFKVGLTLYSKVALETYCEEKEIEIIECPDKVNSKTMLKGKCKRCKEPFKKHFRAMVIGGGPYCYKCVILNNLNDQLEVEKPSEDLDNVYDIMDYVKIKVGGNINLNKCPRDGCMIVSPKHALAFEGLYLQWDQDGYVQVKTSDGLKKSHRYLAELVEGHDIPRGHIVHHKNDIKYDNRLENLEITTQGHNTAAINRKTENSTSIYKGVSFHNDIRKWSARVTYRNKLIHIAFFEDEKEAGKAYDRAYIAIYKSTSGCNELLDKGDVAKIINNPQLYLPKAKNSDRELPKYITVHVNKYVCQIKRGDNSIRASFDTLDEAVTFKDKSLKKIDDDRIREILAQPIKRDAQGVAIIFVWISVKRNEHTFTQVDDKDYYDLVQHKWYISNEYPYSRKLGRMHTYLAKAEDGCVIDHIDQNKLNNRRSNLRSATYSLSARNCSKKRKGSKSKYPGVFLQKQTKRWASKIYVGGKTVWLGYFDKEVDAAKRYQEEFDKIVAQDQR